MKKSNNEAAFLFWSAVIVAILILGFTVWVEYEAKQRTYVEEQSQ